MYYVYIVKNPNNKIYIGISENLKKRIHAHNIKQGALFTQGGNFTIVFYEEYQTLTEARKREIQIKKWSREKKEMLIERFEKGLPTKL
ncbi:MAG: GIY-YIG nuclease family protein [bacterium]|nr:GIY-YIG nuclease family protein [bacterium]